MPRIHVNGADLNYEERGTGPRAIVFAHGLLLSWRMYEAQLAALSSTHRCIAFDFRGQGDSEVTASGYDMDTLAVDAAALIEALHCAPCHFVGLSMGGFVGLRLAIRRPELLRSLSLLDTAADREPRLNIPKYRAMSMMARWVGFKPFVRPVMNILFGKKFLKDPARRNEREEVARRLAANDLTGSIRATEGILVRASVEAELSRIVTPTLALSGSDDRAVVPDRLRRTAERIAGAEFDLIPGAGHSSTLEEPQAVTARLARFLSRVDRASGS